jgi:aminoglycoside phosphotransferase family enzyme/predicted kinase
MTGGALPEHLLGLMRPQAYAHPVRGLRVIETHISWVVLTGDYAYKIKRPVQFSFLDFRALERREFYCREELRLNQRFAPELYLDVCAVTESAEGVQFGGDGKPIEFAVRMRQFAPSDELSALLAHDGLTAVDLSRFGKELAQIHASLPRGTSHAEPERTRGILLTNAAECRNAAVDATARDRVASCIWQLSAAFERLRCTLQQRDLAGFVRECHGDLHVSNVARVDGRLRAFDCLEFEPEFRRIDVAHEIAFLSMDLAAHGCVPLASEFVNAWLSESGDYEACKLLDLYEAHCALVRAKVAGLNVPRVTARERPALVAKQRAFLRLASERLSRPRPRLILMHGLSGSGKSWLAAQLARELPAIWLRSDVERKRLAGLAPLAASHSGVGGELYSHSQSELTYRTLLHHARSVLSGARTAIVDATFLTRSQREPFVELAEELGVPALVVACSAPDTVVDARVNDRARAGADASEATLEVLAWQRQRLDPVVADELLRVVSARTERKDVLADTLRQLQGNRTPNQGRRSPDQR